MSKRDEGLSVIQLPVKIEPREGKHYGTVITDASGSEVIRIWGSKGEPSQREKAYFGDGWTPEAWSDYCCDGHWESEEDLRFATFLVNALNYAQAPVNVPESLNRFSLPPYVHLTGKFDIGPFKTWTDLAKPASAR